MVRQLKAGCTKQYDTQLADKLKRFGVLRDGSPPFTCS